MLFITQPVLCLSCQEYLKKQLLKRVQNVSTPKMQQGATPSRKKARRLSFQSRQETSADETDDSTTSTVILERTPPRCSTPEIEQSYVSAQIEMVDIFFSINGASIITLNKDNSMSK